MKVLLPTDFSPNSIKAIEYAVQALSPIKPDYVLLNTYQSPQAGVSMVVSINELLEKGSREALDNLVKSLQSEHGNSIGSIETVCQFGSVFHGIQECANNKGIDLVAMGTKGETGLQRLVLGSNTAYAIEHCELPVLAIPTEAAYEPIEKVLLASDDSELDPSKAAVLKAMMSAWGSELFVLRVFSPDVPLEDDSLTSIGDLECTYVPRQHPDIIECIDEEISSRNIQLSVAVAKHHGFLHRLMNRSVSQKLALHTNIPLLILRS